MVGESREDIAFAMGFVPKSVDTNGAVTHYKFDPQATIVYEDSITKRYKA